MPGDEWKPSLLPMTVEQENRLLSESCASLYTKALSLEADNEYLRNKIKRLEQRIQSQRAANNGKMKSLLRWQKLTGRHYPEAINEELKYDIGSFD